MSAMPSLASERANARQLEASDPAVSAFVAASAGSGKTKLLVDRLLRLMLAGADPARILCLTFTKAAAAEMALRLQRHLGDWVTLDDAALAEQLKQLRTTPSRAALARARALFADVLDLPGGMRIGTIHAFCQSLLRRFPLEAALPPHFRLLEDADSHAELQGAREGAMAGCDPDALAIMAAQVSDADYGRLITALRPHAAALAPLLAMPGPARLRLLQRATGVEGDDATLLQAAVAWDESTLLAAVLQMKAHGTTEKQRELAQCIFGWLNQPAALRVESWAGWLTMMLTKEGKPRAAGSFLKGKFADANPWIGEAFVAEAERVAAVEDGRRALHVAAATNALLTLAGPVLAGYQQRKRLAGLVEYDDLITRTDALLRNPGAAWVLFKLDGGLDHVLLDEVQDTAPAQWQIAGALTAEFFAGEGAAEGGRTVFAVGDRKQSIYSFQGADPAGFDAWRDRMGQQVRGAGGQFRDTALDVSFRSTSAVLALVDAVFADPVSAAGVVVPGQVLRHEAHRAGQAGEVALWPLVPAALHEVPEPWAVADRNHGLLTAPQRLADALAHWIVANVGTAPLRGHTLQAGDILVLVRRRDDFARTLVRRLKGLGVPVAGLDRLYLAQQPAVQDLLALCDTLLLPGDDLSLACVLTSPLGELDDDDLMALAIGRTGSLWATLHRRRAERPHWDRVAGFLSALFGRVDYVTPHALLVEALGPMGGRARLLRRLGPDAAEPIDELLGAAMAHAAAHPPSLQGFMHWLRQSGAEVKREAEGAGGAVRVMTVHGAKGLQSPLVILPDTTALPPEDHMLAWDGEVPLWSPRKELCCAAVERLRAHARQARLEEYNRLLYVALTRAEDRLLVCGWHPRTKSLKDECWYETVRRGLLQLGAAEEVLAGVGEAWDGAVLVHRTHQATPLAEETHPSPAAHPAIPRWAGAPPDWVPHAMPVEPARPTPLAPSRPTDAGLGLVPHAASPLAGGGGALERGTLIHHLLQHAPVLPPAERHAAVLRHVTAAGASPAIVDEVMAILGHPALSPLFGPHGRAEQPLAGFVEGAVVSGVVDRLAVLADAVLVADYKTNRDAPDRAEATPVLYLRQMAAYRAVLRLAFPGRPVRCALVWTRTATVMPLPDALLDGHAPGLVSKAQLDPDRRDAQLATSDSGDME